MKKIVVLLMATALVASASASVLYDNGPFITHPGQGAGGADVSMCSVNPNSAGSNIRLSTAPYFRGADDFFVPAGGWLVTGIRTFAYETNAHPPTWTGGSMKIWAGDRPEAPGTTPVFETTAMPTRTFTNVYRVFNGTANLMNTQRPVYALDWAVPNLQLPAGQYWVDVQVIGGASGWYNYVMDINPSDPNNPITRPGNAWQLTATGWNPAVAGTPEVSLTYPFQVIPEPASLLLLGLGLLLRRR